MITQQLFFQEALKKKQGRKHTSSPDAADPITRHFGTVMPSSIPESTEWWKVQQKQLFAISEDAENGLMQEMVTLTMNDSSAELIATVRRGPFAIPTDEERLLTVACVELTGVNRLLTKTPFLKTPFP